MIVSTDKIAFNLLKNLRHNLTPDIVVEFDPNSFSMTADPQLEAAVASLMHQIGADSDCRDEPLIEQTVEIKAKPAKKK